jgi:hypothetical protein
MSTKSLLIFVTALRKRYEEMLPGPKVHLFAEKVEYHEERPPSDFPLFLDPSSHA